MDLDFLDDLTKQYESESTELTGPVTWDDEDQSLLDKSSRDIIFYDANDRALVPCNNLTQLFSSRGRCALCPGTHRLVNGDGPAHTEVMLIGEAPGQEEDRGGRPFIGRSGKELNFNYLIRMGMNRPGIYFTNTVKCRPEGNKKPSDKLRVSCASHYITDEVRLVNPKVILLMGATACALPNIEIDLEKDHGYPIKLEPGQGGLLGDFTGYIIPFYHPAAGMHNTAMMIPLLEDSEFIKLWNEELWEPPIDLIPDRQYELFDNKNDLLAHLVPGLPLALDTETTSDTSLYSVQWSQVPGTGYGFILNHAPGLLETFIDFVNSDTADFIGQNILYDYGKLIPYGLYVDRFRFQDTMHRAFHLGNLPQGLKAMSSRLLGIRMTSFQDTVMPSSIEYLGYWWDVVMSYAHSLAPLRVTRGPANQIMLVPKDTKLTGAVTRTRTSTIKPFDKARAFYKRYELESKGVPPPPLPGIEYTDPALAKWYMCQDPDVTLRCNIELVRRIRTAMQGRLNLPVDKWRDPRVDAQIKAIEGQRKSQWHTSRISFAGLSNRPKPLSPTSPQVRGLLSRPTGRSGS